MEILNKSINWLKENKLTAAIVLVSAYFVLVSNNQTTLIKNTTGTYYDREPAVFEAVGSKTGLGVASDYAAAPQTAKNVNSDRRTVTNSQISILVKDVRGSVDSIKKQVELTKGFVVNLSIKTPLEGESGNMTIRVPLTAREDIIIFLRELGIKTVSENISSADVTDQYTDFETRLATLRTTKQRFEEIMEEAKDVDEILRVQQRIFSIQDQIDSIEGQLRYLNTTTTTTLIRIDLSTDELALPYAPANKWSPGVVFKLAVRSLATTGQQVGTLIIWAVTYSVVWIPALMLFKVVRNKKKVPKRKRSK